MVKSGSFKVNQGSTLGRIGSGVGKGLSEQLPKEIERGRLAQGLEQFNKESANLSPVEQYSKLVPLLSGSPHGAQALQILPELLKQQNLRNAYANRSKGEGQNVPEEGSLQPREFFQPGRIGSQGNEPTQMQGQQTVRPEDQGQPQIIENNPLRNEAIPGRPWSDQRREQEISNAFERGFATTLPEAVQYASDKEQRELAQPLAVQKQDEYLRDQKDRLDADLDKRMSTLLETSGEKGKIFEDLSGEDINNIKRSADRDLRTSPGATIEDISNKWAKKGLDLAKTRTDVNTLANRGFTDRITDPEKTFDKLKSYQKIFAETGNQENYFTSLKEKFGLSNNGAAVIAFPRSKEVSSYIKNFPSSIRKNSGNASTESRKFAADLSNHLSRDDSILAIASEMRRKDINFDPHAFFSQLRDDLDILPFTPFQKREIAKGMESFIPTWGDISILPWGANK